jgi:arylsulfatase
VLIVLIDDVGWEAGSPVSPDYGVCDNAFTGEVHWVRIQLGEEDFGHLVPDDVHISHAMMRQ